MSVADYGRGIKEDAINMIKNAIKKKTKPVIIVLIVIVILFIVILGAFGLIEAEGSENGYTNLGSGIYGGTVEEKVWFSLRALGINEYAVAGVMGNIEGESSFNPNCIEQPSQEGIGLCQWSFGRKTQLQNYATSKGVEWTDVDTQIEFLIGEISKGGGADGYANFQMSGTHYGYTYDTWCNANDTDTATEAFMAVFERPNMTLAHTDRRKTSAQTYYNTFHGKIYTVEGNATNNPDIVNMRNSSQYGQNQIWSGGGECFGFVNAVTKEYYGTACDVWEFSNGTNTHTKVGKGWSKNDNPSAVDYLKPGDSIRWHRSASNNVGHSAWVIAVQGENVILAEANYSAKNKIDWTRTVTKSQIKEDHFDYVCIAPYAIGEK